MGRAKYFVIAAAMSLAAALAIPAHAATVQQYSFHGTVAEAYWVTTVGTDVLHADVTVARNRFGRFLGIFEVVTHFDTDGRFTGSTNTVVGVKAGFSLSIDASLSSAAVNGSGLPAATCSYDAENEPLGCASSTVDVRVRWIGVGVITRGHSTAHFHAGSFTSIYHQSGASREAAAVGNLDGTALTAGDLVTALLSANTYGSVEVCAAPLPC